MTDRAVTGRHALACRLARQAGAVALELWADRAALTVEAKDNPQDVVSRADRAVEAVIRDGIAAAFPHDAVLGEEGGATGGDSGFGWVIDPIDGTMPFLSGLPHWCVAIAVTRAHETVAAATCAPVRGTLYDALRGGGTRRDGVPLSLCDAPGLTGRMTGIGASHRTDPAHVADTIRRLMEAGGIFCRSGSGALMLAEVAEGALAGYYEPHMHPWDARGGLLLVDEAGGRSLPFPADGGPVLAASPAAFAALVAVADRA
jgi:myo-inositol-1(or 4)-monophosphatase